jgi:hypothetical protein
LWMYGYYGCIYIYLFNDIVLLYWFNVLLCICFDICNWFDIFVNFYSSDMLSIQYSIWYLFFNIREFFLDTLYCYMIYRIAKFVKFGGFNLRLIHFFVLYDYL